MCQSEPLNLNKDQFFLTQGHDDDDDEDEDDDDDDFDDDEYYFRLIFSPLCKYMISLMLVTLYKTNKIN